MENKENIKKLIGCIIFITVILIAITVSILITKEKHEPYNGESQMIKYKSSLLQYNSLKEKNSPIVEAYDYVRNYLDKNDYKIIKTHDEYVYLLEKNYISNMSSEDNIDSIDIQDLIQFDESFFDNNNLIAVMACSVLTPEINFYEEENNWANLSIIENTIDDSPYTTNNYIIFIPANKSITHATVEYISEVIPPITSTVN